MILIIFQFSQFFNFFPIIFLAKVERLLDLLWMVETPFQEPDFIDKANNDGFTPLMAAAQEGHLDSLNLLLKRNSSIIGNNHGVTSLHLAANNYRQAIIQQLLKYAREKSIYPAMIHKADGESKTPLVMASFYGDLSNVEDLLKENASIDQTDNDGATPLMAAVQEGHLDTVSLLLKYNASIEIANNHGATALYFAATKNRFAEARLLFNTARVNHVLEAMREKPDNEGRTPLYMASFYGYLKMVEVILGENALVDNASNDGSTPLMAAAQQGHLDTVLLLLKHNANIHMATNEGSTALYRAASNGHKDVVEALVFAKAKIERFAYKKFTSLHIAAGTNRYGVVKYMLEHPIAKSIINDVTNEYHSTPLASAIRWGGDLKMVKLLVSEGADTTIKDRTGKAPLQMAIGKGKNDIVNYLREYKQGKKKEKMIDR